MIAGFLFGCGGCVLHIGFGFAYNWIFVYNRV